MGFQEDLKNSIFNPDPNLDRKQLLEDVFKSFVARLFEHVMTRRTTNQSRLTFDELVHVKKNLINEFRTAQLAEYQQSEQWYDDLFETTVKEIFESTAHQGVSNVGVANQNLEINKEAYKFEKGLFLPKG